MLALSITENKPITYHNANKLNKGNKNIHQALKTVNHFLASNSLNYDSLQTALPVIKKKLGSPHVLVNKMVYTKLLMFISVIQLSAYNYNFDF